MKIWLRHRASISGKATMALMTRVTLAIVAACTLATMSVPDAHALDGFWHGVRSKFWHHGTNGEVSNWYDMAPQSGSPLKVPDGTAIFAPGALRNRAEVEGSRTIRSVVFSQGNDPYNVVVRPSSMLKIKGPGATNASGVEQTFRVRGTGAKLLFTRKSVACKTPGPLELKFRVTNGGKTFFKNKSSINTGCYFFLKSDSLLQFLDGATAGNANILLRSPSAIVKFNNNSDPKKAVLDIDGGKAIFRTFGPKGDRRISAKRIYCQCTLDLGKSNLKVRKKVDIGKNSDTFISVLNLVTYGRIHASSAVELGGTLHVEGSLDTKPGTYTLFQSDKQRSFQFASTDFTGFRKNLTVEIVYTNKAAQMVVSKKKKP